MKGEWIDGQVGEQLKWHLGEWQERRMDGQMGGQMDGQMVG